MFTGLVKSIGTLVKQEEVDSSCFVFVDSPVIADQVELGSSVANNGVCLSVLEKNGSVLKYQLMPETLKCTSFGNLKKGHRINLETSLKVGDEFGGHFVTGHIDFVGKILRAEKNQKTMDLEIEADPEFMKFIVSKGSVALNGVSLTITDVNQTSFGVSLIQDTMERTNLGELKMGESVNVECDMLAKYLGKLLKK